MLPEAERERELALIDQEIREFQGRPPRRRVIDDDNEASPPDESESSMPPPRRRVRARVINDDYEEDFPQPPIASEHERRLQQSLENEDYELYMGLNGYDEETLDDPVRRPDEAQTDVLLPAKDPKQPVGASIAGRLSSPGDVSNLAYTAGLPSGDGSGGRTAVPPGPPPGQPGAPPPPGTAPPPVQNEPKPVGMAPKTKLRFQFSPVVYEDPEKQKLRFISVMDITDARDYYSQPLLNALLKKPAQPGWPILIEGAPYGDWKYETKNPTFFSG